MSQPRYVRTFLGSVNACDRRSQRAELSSRSAAPFDSATLTGAADGIFVGPCSLTPASPPGASHLPRR